MCWKVVLLFVLKFHGHWKSQMFFGQHTSYLVLVLNIAKGFSYLSLWYVLWPALRSGHCPDERRYISNHFIRSLLNYALSLLQMTVRCGWSTVCCITQSPSAGPG